MSTITCFDWDDTLCPSSHLSKLGIGLGTNLSVKFEKLEKSIIKLLRIAITRSQVFIITNSETGWVRLSARKFLPGVVSILEECVIISARSSYEKLFPEEPIRWKYEAFKTLLTKDTECIISIGDSICERDAVRLVVKGSDAVVKTVKLAHTPSIEQLLRQQELITGSYHYIHDHDDALDLMLTIKIIN